jgi:hypothetical protein
MSDPKQNPRDAGPLPQLCYDVAYFILPHYAFGRLDKLSELCLDTPAVAGPFFYVMAAKAREIEPNFEHAKQFRWHYGFMEEGREYFALEYPTPPAGDHTEEPLGALLSGGMFVLAPYFSVIVRSNDEVHYYILGQAPLNSGTTLRRVTQDGANCNLGSGPAPTLDGFLAAVSENMNRSS